MKKYNQKLIGNNIQWSIEYNHGLRNDGCIHTIILSKYDNLNEEQVVAFNKLRIKAYTEQEMIHLVDNICDGSYKLFDFKQEFLKNKETKKQETKKDVKKEQQKIEPAKIKQ